jgi:hypothetical protein
MLSISGVCANSCSTGSVFPASRSATSLGPLSARYLLTSSELNGSRQMAPFSFKRVGSQRYSLSRQQTTSPDGLNSSINALIAEEFQGTVVISSTQNRLPSNSIMWFSVGIAWGSRRR